MGNTSLELHFDYQSKAQPRIRGEHTKEILLYQGLKSLVYLNLVTLRTQEIGTIWVIFGGLVKVRITGNATRKSSVVHFSWRCGEFS